MFFPKRLTGLVLSGLLFVSCSPLTPPSGTSSAPVQATPVTSAQKPKTVKKSSSKSKSEAARIKANKEAAARRARLKKKKAAAAKAAKASKSSSSSSSSTSSSQSKPKTTTVSAPKKPKPKSKYRTATAIPGKSGFVFNPWTNKAVDVRGIPGGSVVRDPNDGNPDHKFRVP